MARLDSNKLLPILGVMVLVLLVVVAGGSVFSKGDVQPQPRTALPSPDELPDVDTPADTIRALNAELAAANDNFKELAKQNEELLADNEDLRADQKKIREQLTEELDEKLAAANSERDTQFNQSVNSLGQQLAALKSSLTVKKTREKPAETADSSPLLTGSGIGDYPIAGAQTGEYIWVKPLDSSTGAPAQGVSSDLSNNDGFSGLLSPSFDPTGTPAGLAAGDELVATRIAGSPGTTAPPAPAPYFTINNLATLAGSTAFTAMIGRVPINGQIADPVPFRVLVGRDNLAASGLRVPDEIASMVFEGVAIGDWTLGCVEGSLRAATFVFEDGTIRTVTGGEGQSGRLGYIADRFGTPCVAGERISNAGSFLAAQVGLAAGSGAAEAFSAAQTAQVVEGGAISSAVVGDLATFALGRSASDATEQVQQYLADRLSSTFDAIYVPPGQEVALLIQQEIAIDYDPAGRKLDHATAGVARTRTLD